MDRIIKFRYAYKDLSGQLFFIEKDIADFLNSTMSSHTRIQTIVSVDQFTGKVDKSGNDIYDKDVVRILYTDWLSMASTDLRTLQQYLNDISKIGLVEWNNCESCWRVLIDGYYHDIDCGKHGFIEIIGNIHQHPELIN